MAILIQPATSSHDDAVRALFAEAQVPIDPQAWARAYDPAAPGDGPDQPFVAVDQAGGVVGFFAIQPATLDVMGDPVRAGLVHDFVVSAHAADGDAPALMLRDAIGRSDLTLACGAGLRFTRALAALSFLCAGHFLRVAAMPDDPPGEGDPFALRPVPEFPADMAWADAAMAAERRIFRPRAADRLRWLFRGHVPGFELLEAHSDAATQGYAVVRRAEGRRGDELHVVDFACRGVDMGRMAAGLAKLARERDVPVFASVFGDGWRGPFERAGFRVLRPRWPLHWILADPRLRVLGNSLLRRDAWHFTAADGAIDA